MTDVVITVQGRHVTTRPAELGTIRLAAHFQGADRRTVLGSVTGAASAVQSVIAEFGDAVESWSSNAVRVWSERPWDPNGAQLDPVLHAQADVEAVLTDADALSRLIDRALAIDGVIVPGVEWSLTTESERGALAETRSAAVVDAVDKATVYAAAVGRRDIAVTAIADAGMLDGSMRPGGGIPVGSIRAMSASDSPGFTLVPQPIEVEVVVDVRFTAR